MADKNIVHLRKGGKVVIDGDRVEVYLDGPVVFHRKHWVRHILPAEEASRCLRGATEDPVGSALVEAFAAVPMTVYREDD